MNRPLSSEAATTSPAAQNIVARGDAVPAEGAAVRTVSPHR